MNEDTTNHPLWKEDNGQESTEFQCCENCGSMKEYDANDLYYITSERYFIPSSRNLNVCPVCAFELGVKWLINKINAVIKADNYYIKNKVIEITSYEGDVEFFKLSKEFIESTQFTLPNNTFVHDRCKELSKIYSEIINEYGSIEKIF